MTTARRSSKPATAPKTLSAILDLPLVGMSKGGKQKFTIPGKFDKERNVICTAYLAADVTTEWGDPTGIRVSITPTYEALPEAEAEAVGA